MFKILAFLLVEITLHLAAIVSLFWSFIPLAKWYIGHLPILGVDFYNMVANVAYYSRNLSPRFAGFKPISWGGFPYSLDYPSLHFYLINPLVSVFGPQQATLYYTMGTIFLFIISCYFLFWVISRSKAISFVLAFLTMYSTGVWGPVIWGGNLQYTATMFTLPLTAGFLVLFKQSKSRKFLAIAALIAGLSAYGHPQILIAYTMIFSVIFLGLNYYSNFKATIKRVLADIVIFLVLIYLLAYAQLSHLLGENIFLSFINILNFFTPLLNRFSSTQEQYGYSIPSTASSGTLEAIAKYNRAEFWRFRDDVNSNFYMLIGATAVILILAFILAKNKKRFMGIFPYVVFAGFLFLFIFGLSHGFSFLQGGWYRVFWPFPIALGALIAYGYRSFWMSLMERFGKINNVFGKLVLAVIFSAAVIAAGGYIYVNEGPEKFIDRIDVIHYRERSGVFPEILNKPVSKQEFENLGQKLVPSWIDTTSHQYRLYSADQKVNIWWPTFFEMPLFRGYTDSPVGSGRAGGYFWTDIALASNSGKDPLVEDFKTPVDIAKNNALFLIDWFSIGYYEGGHPGSDSFTPPASYLINDKEIIAKEEKISNPGYSQIYETKNGNRILWKEDLTNDLRYFQFQPSLVSPILSALNTTVVGLVGDFQNYETFLRVLGMTNINSQKLIPIWIGDSLKNIPDLDDLNIDALILYGYKDGENPGGTAKIEKYLKNGGKVFIETGSDVAQTSSNKLPKYFPIEGTKKDKIGMEWDLKDFAAPVLDGKPWMFSLPSKVKENSQVILKTNEIPLIVKGSYGKGEVVWSGTNLFYHANVYKNLKEGEFIGNLLKEWISLEPLQAPQYQTVFKDNQNIKITANSVRAVLLRQEFYNGWEAKINGEKVKIYSTGPIYPGFMFVSVPAKFRNSEITVEYKYNGDSNAFNYTILLLITAVLIIDYLLGARLINIILFWYKRFAVVKITNWWRKDDE